MCTHSRQNAMMDVSRYQTHTHTHTRRLCNFSIFEAVFALVTELYVCSDAHRKQCKIDVSNAIL